MPFALRELYALDPMSKLDQLQVIGWMHRWLWPPR